MAGAYRATGSTRRPKTSGLPPATENPGPWLPIDPINPTDPSAYYNAARAAGQAPERVVFNRAQQSTPNIVLTFDQAANAQKQGTFTGKELNEIASFYKAQIDKLFAGQMDALANQHKEGIAHASTRDAFAIVKVTLEAEVTSRKNAEILLGDLRKALSDLESEFNKLKEQRGRSAGDNDDVAQLRRQLQIEKIAVIARDATIKLLQSDLSEAQQLIRTNQTTFTAAFRARDNRVELQVQLAKEQEEVADLEAQLSGSKSIDPDGLRTQLRDERAKVKKRDTNILDFQAQLEDASEGKDVIDGPLEFVQRMLRDQAQRTGGAASSISEDALNLIAKHQSFMAKIGTDVIPKFSRSTVICHIINAQISLSKGAPMKALDFLAKAKPENDNGKFDRRIDGRIHYWTGKALLMINDKLGAESFLEQAFNIERRPSSFGTLYNLQGVAVEDWGRADDEDDKPNFLAMGKALEVEKWLTKAKEAKTPSP